MIESAFPDVVVDLVGQQEKPLASIAVVRRALQRAGQEEAASRFTLEELASSPEQVFDIARRYVRLRI